MARQIFFFFLPSRKMFAHHWYRTFKSTYKNVYMFMFTLYTYFYKL